MLKSLMGWSVRLGDSLFHLDPARSTFGGPDLDVAIAQPPEEDRDRLVASSRTDRGRRRRCPPYPSTPVDKLDVELKHVAQELQDRDCRRSKREDDTAGGSPREREVAVRRHGS